MTNPIAGPGGQRRRFTSLGATVLIGTAASVVLIAGAAPARAQCASDEDLLSVTVPAATANNSNSNSTYNGTYILCIGQKTASTNNVPADLSSTPWFTGNDGLAIALADALQANYATTTDPYAQAVPTNQGNGNVVTTGALFLTQANGILKAVGYTIGSTQGSSNNYQPNSGQPYWYVRLDPPISESPGPLPILGAATAFGWSRRLRRRLSSALRPLQPQRSGP